MLGTLWLFSSKMADILQKMRCLPTNIAIKTGNSHYNFLAFSYVARNTTTLHYFCIRHEKNACWIDGALNDYKREMVFSRICHSICRTLCVLPTSKNRYFYKSCSHASYFPTFHLLYCFCESYKFIWKLACETDCCIHIARVFLWCALCS